MNPDNTITEHCLGVFAGGLLVGTTSCRRWLPGMLFALMLLCCGSAWAADFSLHDIQGQAHRLSDYRGKWVLVNFWAT